MTASDWAAWVGAVSGVGAFVWEVVRWFREGPRLLVRASPNMTLFPPDNDGRQALIVHVTNTGNQTTTLTHLAMMEFTSWYTKWRVNASRNWVVTNEGNLGQPLPHELQPGQQWTAVVRQNPEVVELISSQKLFVGIYHAFAPGRPVLAHAKPSSPQRKAKT